MDIWDDSCKETIDTFVKPIVFRELTYVGSNQFDYSIFKTKELQNAVFAMRFLFGQLLSYLQQFKKAGEELKADIESYRNSI